MWRWLVICLRALRLTSRQDTGSQFFDSWAFCLFSILPLSCDSPLLSVHCWAEDLSEEAVLLKWHLSVPGELCPTSAVKFVWQMATEGLCSMETHKCTYCGKLCGNYSILSFSWHFTISLLYNCVEDVHASWIPNTKVFFFSPHDQYEDLSRTHHHKSFLSALTTPFPPPQSYWLVWQ